MHGNLRFLFLSMEYVWKSSLWIGIFQRAAQRPRIVLISIMVLSCLYLIMQYADLVWGDKHNVTLLSGLQVLQNKAAKMILDRPLNSFATHALATLKWVAFKIKGSFQRRCAYVHKCLNGLISWFTPIFLLFNNLYLTYNPLEYSTNWKSGEGLIT